jgi:hypothetical protein
MLDGSNGLNSPNLLMDTNNVTNTINALNDDIDEYKVNRLASEKSTASFGNVNQRPRDADDLFLEAEKQVKEAAANAVDPSGTQFEFSTDQLERNRHKALNGLLQSNMHPLPMVTKGLFYAVCLMDRPVR